MTNDPPAGPPLGWRRAELALMFPTMVWPAALILGNGPITGFAVLLSGLFAPLIVPGRRACGWASIIVGSCYLALSIPLIMVGFAVIAPAPVILILVGVGYLRPDDVVPRAFAWTLMLITAAFTLREIIRFGLPIY